MVMFWGFFVYWGMYFSDKYICSVTGGDYKNLLCDRFRNPFMDKLGLMRFRGKTYANSFKSSLVFMISLLFALSNLLITFIDLNKYGEPLFFSFENTLHDLTVALSEVLVEHLSPYIMVNTPSYNTSDLF